MNTWSLELFFNPSQQAEIFTDAATNFKYIYKEI